MDRAYDPLLMAGALGVYAVVMLLCAIAAWRILEKAGRPGWVALVPVYGVLVGLEVVGRPPWWLLLLLIPGVQIIVVCVLGIDLAKSFGKGAAFGIGLAFGTLIFAPMLAFGDASYQGPAAPPPAG